MSKAEPTTDHAAIREWVEKHEGRPSVVSDTCRNGREGAVLRIDFGDRDEGLEEIEWDEFFRIFDESKLAFLRSEDQDESRFNKFVSRN